MHPQLGAGDPSRLGGYRLLARLGAGGMGQVYLARSPGGRTVALKVVRPELTADRGFRARFRREVDAARRVSGAYTAPVLDADPEAEVPWLATAYVPGPALADAVADHGPLPEHTVRTLAVGLAEALTAVHAAGLVHRDLKPSNVLLALDGPRLIDFGISRAADDTVLTGTGLVVGSPSYMSPEQADGGEVGRPSDVFSLASVLVFAATGLGPFGTGSAPSLLYRVVHADPDLAAVPAYLRPIVEPCLAKNPAHRPAPAEVMARALPSHASTVIAGPGGWLPPHLADQAARHQAATGMYEAPAQSPPPAYGGPRDAVHGTGTYTHVPPIPGPPAPASAPGSTPPPPGSAPGSRPPSTPSDVRQRAVRRRGFIAAGTGAVAAIGWGSWSLLGGGGTGKSSGTGSAGAASNDAGIPGDPSDGRPVYRIGVQVNTGNRKSYGYAESGKNILQAVTVACDVTNTTAGLPFRVVPLHIATEDAGPDPAVVRAACKDPRLIAIIGPQFGSEIPAFGPVYRDEQIAAVSVTAGWESDATAAFGDVVLHALDPEAGLCTDLAGYVVRKHKPKHVHIIDPVTAPGPSLGDRLASLFTAADVATVTGKGTRIPDTSAATNARVVADARGADVLIWAGYGGEDSLVVALAGAGFATTPRYGLYGTPDTNGASYFTPTTLPPIPQYWQAISPYADLTRLSGLAPLTTRYQQVYGAAPGLGAAETFDVTHMIVDTLKNLGGSPTRRAMLDALKRTTYQGAARKYAFDATGHAATHASYIYEGRGGSMLYIGTTAA